MFYTRHTHTHTWADDTQPLTRTSSFAIRLVYLIYTYRRTVSRQQQPTSSAETGLGKETRDASLAKPHHGILTGLRRVAFAFAFVYALVTE